MKMLYSVEFAADPPKMKASALVWQLIVPLI